MPPFWRSRWVHPRTSRVGQALELRELDLHFAFVALRALREDIQDEARAIDDTAIEARREIALLHRREIVIEDRDGCVRRGDRLGNLLDFAFAGKERRVGPLAASLDHGRCVDAGARGKLFRFCQAFCVIGLAQIEAYEDRLRAAAGTLGHQTGMRSEVNQASPGRTGS